MCVCAKSEIKKRAGNPALSKAVTRDFRTTVDKAAFAQTSLKSKNFGQNEKQTKNTVQRRPTSRKGSIAVRREGWLS